MQRLRTPRIAADFFRSRMSPEVEEVWVAALNSDIRILAAQCLFRGTVNECTVHPRDVFRFACLHNAVSLVVAHNHPSGVAEPSPEDDEWTNRLLTAANIFSIGIMDHVIVTQRSYYSYLESGRLVTKDDHRFGRNVHEVAQEGEKKKR